MILYNCEVKWARLTAPDQMSGKWSIRIYLSPEQADALRAERLELKADEDKRVFINASRKPVTSKGKKVEPPRVVGMDKKPFEKEIGNGSICNIIADPYDWTFGNKTGRGLWLNAVQVVTWKEYVGHEDFDAPEGAQVNEPVNEFDDLPFK